MNHQLALVATESHMFMHNLKTREDIKNENPTKVTKPQTLTPKPQTLNPKP
jgi:hypothetical protein